MADFLNLALSDYTDTASKVSLLTGRWKLRWGGYQPAAGTGRGKITETLALVAEGTAAELSAGERLIQSLLEQARRWSEDSLTENGVWLEWSVDGEPGAGTYAAIGSSFGQGYLNIGLALAPAVTPVPEPPTLALIAMTAAFGLALMQLNARRAENLRSLS